MNADRILMFQMLLTNQLLLAQILAKLVSNEKYKEIIKDCNESAKAMAEGLFKEDK